MSTTRPDAKGEVPQPSFWRSLVRSVLFVLLGLVVAYPLSRGLSFYKLGLDGRLDHPEYRDLSPGGFVGHGYGIVGTALILTNLLYLARRRVAWLPVGSLNTWLDVHVVTGIGGSILVMFHSAFQLRTPIAGVTAISLGIVVLTGLIGRYIYALTPRTGEKSLEQRLREIDSSMPAFAGGVREALRALPTTNLPANASIVRVLLTIPRWVLEARRRGRAIEKLGEADAQLEALRRSGERKFAKWIVSDVARLSAGEIDRIAGGALLRLWRSMHRITAILMVLSVAIHIGVAWFYGYRWIFTRE
jgi:hypothetical protein